MSEIRCFLLERTNMGRRVARRFSTAHGCTLSNMGCHDAETIVGDEPFTNDELDGDFTGKHPERWDAVWPTSCACGYTFAHSDHFQYGVSRLYRHPETGALYRLRHGDLPVGAMWDVPWMADIKGYGHPDGRCLRVMTPGGEWTIDGPSYSNGVRSGAGWQRVGNPPNITVSPSILIHNPDGTEAYHGWLRNGVLVPC